MIRKIEGIMPPIENVSDTQKKFAGLKFYKNVGKNFCCAVSYHDNNDIANLELVTKDEHKKIHLLKKSKRRSEKNQNLLALFAEKNFKPSIEATTPIARPNARKLLSESAPLK